MLQLAEFSVLPDTPNDPNFKLDNRSVLFVRDIIDTDILTRYLKNFGHPKYICNFGSFEYHGISSYCLPVCLCQIMQKDFAGLSYENTTNVESCFNFMINKKTTNRILLLKMVEYFELHSDLYTWSGASKSFDMSSSIRELEFLKQSSRPLDMDNKTYDLFFTSLLSPCEIQPRTVDFANQLVSDEGIKNYGGNLWTWLNGLQYIFLNTAVSLISESVAYQKASGVTEKTGYAVLGLTFPVWIGGYGTAQAWQRAGFDIFDDVIDHSYQFKETLLERCYYAFRDNLKILKDIEFAQTQRERCKQRLLDNRNKLLQGTLTDYCRKTFDQWPDDLKSVMQAPLMRYF